MNVYRVDYFPEVLFSAKLEPKLNPYWEAEFLDDKNLLPILFDSIEGLHIPSTYAACVRGRFRDSDGKFVEKVKVMANLADIGNCVIKKTRDTDSGRDVMICNITKGDDLTSGKSLSEIFELMGGDFVVQEKIVQHPCLNGLYDKAINTFRVISYFCEGELYVGPIALRMGRNGADRDNIHFGGIAIGLNDDDSLKDKAFTEYGEVFTSHPDSKVVFSDYRLLACGGVILRLKEMAILLHSRMPFMGVLGWDLTIDSNNQVVVVEVNSIGTGIWLNQFVNGEPLFGDNTPKMLNLIR